MSADSDASLVLEDGAVFSGRLKGAPVAGEVVFSTGMTGYPEALSDPSYRGQLLVMTYPLIGNYGVPAMRGMPGAGYESERCHAQALIVGTLAEDFSHHSAERSLAAWLREEGVPILHGVDTRALTQHLRERGVMLGRLVAESAPDFEDPNARNLVAEVSTRTPVTYGHGKHRIVLVDCGVKAGIIRELLSRDTTVVRIPWDHSPLDYQPDGIVLSNGPGDPRQCAKTIAHAREALDARVPLFGICLGHQLLALAAGAETYKMRYGHRSQNQPCTDRSGRCLITSQNHGFAVKEDTLPEGWSAWWTNANDRSNEGIRHASGRACSVQFHPEGSPGPQDAVFLFDSFLEVVRDG